MQEIIRKIEISIENLKDKKSRVYFFVQDTKGNARASVKQIYDMALTLKNSGFNTIILHDLEYILNMKIHVFLIVYVLWFYNLINMVRQITLMLMVYNLD